MVAVLSLRYITLCKIYLEWRRLFFKIIILVVAELKNLMMKL